MSLHDNEDNDDVLRCGSNLWVGVDSIAVSLSTNSIRRQDPNTYSDTEMRALSGWVGNTFRFLLTILMF